MKEKQRLESSLFKRIEKLIEEGIEITRLSQENDVMHLPKTEESDFYVWDIKDQYVIWKLECNKIVEKIGHHNSIFAESNSVSLTSGTIMQVPINPTSIAGQKMLISIREETSKGLEFLRKIIDGNIKINTFKLDNDIIKISGEKGFFNFNKITGSIIFNKIKTNFPPEQQKFKIIKVILTSLDNQGSYKDISQELNIKSGSSSNRKISLLVKDIKKDLNILPKNHKSSPDIFKSVPRVGYRIHLD